MLIRSKLFCHSWPLISQDLGCQVWKFWLSKFATLEHQVLKTFMISFGDLESQILWAISLEEWMKSQFGKKLNPSQVLKPANQNYQHCLHKHYQTVSCKKVSRLGKPSLEECNHCQDLGTWSCKNVTFQNLVCQVLKEICKISDLWQPSLDKYFHLCSCLGRPSHERHNSILT